MKFYKTAGLAFAAGCLCGAGAAAVVLGGEDVPVLNPLVMQTLANDCLTLKGTPVPKYLEGKPTQVYRLDCMR